MTFKELMKLRYPEKSDEKDFPNWGCPAQYFDDPPTAGLHCPKYPPDCGEDCEYCWNREVPEDTLNKVKAELGIVSKVVGEALSKGFLDGVNDDPDPEIVDKFAHMALEQLYLTEDLKAAIKEAPEFEQMPRQLESGEDFGPRILDSGNRRQFETGAVRDICEGKGRCDLLPLDVVAYHYDHAGCADELSVFHAISRFQEKGDEHHLYHALDAASHIFSNTADMLLEVAKHFEEGCKKYGDNNWQKGIPTHCYVDSAVRHYLKYLRGDKDEPHDRAFCWNILCCIWTCIHKPELNDYRKEDGENDISES